MLDWENVTTGVEDVAEEGLVAQSTGQVMGLSDGSQIPSPQNFLSPAGEVVGVPTMVLVVTGSVSPLAT